ncbi:MAG: chorismate mutase [Chloroflexota bacterium]
MHINGSSNQSQQLFCRGVRGATTITQNDKEEILEATRELLTTLIRLNDIRPEDVASAYFTTTVDVNVTYPAVAARQLGWLDVALLCGHEMQVPNSLPMCIRVLIHWNTTRSQKEIVHVYLRDAKSLRPDRLDLPPVEPEQMSPIVAAVEMLARTL